MAHFIIEYSANLDADQLDIQSLLAKLHESADSTGLFPLKGIRSRAYSCEHFHMADGNPQHGFVHLQVKLGTGRSMADRERTAKQFFTILSDHLEHEISQRGMAISFEMKELEPVLKYNKNNIQQYLPEPMTNDDA